MYKPLYEYNSPLFDINEFNFHKVKDVNIKTADKEKRQKKEEYNKQITQLKMQLRNTDYQALKFAEGQITAADYEAIKIQRQAWRDEINRLENEIGGLNKWQI